MLDFEQDLILRHVHFYSRTRLVFLVRAPSVHVRRDFALGKPQREDFLGLSGKRHVTAPRTHIGRGELLKDNLFGPLWYATHWSYFVTGSAECLAHADICPDLDQQRWSFALIGA